MKELVDWKLLNSVRASEATLQAAFSGQTDFPLSISSVPFVLRQLVKDSPPQAIRLGLYALSQMKPKKADDRETLYSVTTFLFRELDHQLKLHPPDEHDAAKLRKSLEGLPPLQFSFRSFFSPDLAGPLLPVLWTETLVCLCTDLFAQDQVKVAEVLRLVAGLSDKDVLGSYLTRLFSVLQSTPLSSSKRTPGQEVMLLLLRDLAGEIRKTKLPLPIVLPEKLLSGLLDKVPQFPVATVAYLAAGCGPSDAGHILAERTIRVIAQQGSFADHRDALMAMQRAFATSKYETLRLLLAESFHTLEPTWETYHILRQLLSDLSHREVWNSKKGAYLGCLLLNPRLSRDDLVEITVLAQSYEQRRGFPEFVSFSLSFTLCFGHSHPLLFVS